MPTPPLSDEVCQQTLAAVAEHGSISAAALAMGVNRATFDGRVRTARARLAGEARIGLAPGHFNHGTAPGYSMAKVTIQRGPEGNVERTWERQTPDAEAQQEVMQAAFEAMSADLPRAEPVSGPTETLDDLCNMYSYFDYHIGMLAWNREGGDDWDLTIAGDRLVTSYAAMVEQSPKAHKAVVVLGGDWLHSDGLLPVTPASRNVLDADGRFAKIVDVAIKGARHLCRLALERHEEVELVVMEGNHDESSSGVWLRKMFQVLFEDEPRLTVNNSELPFYVSRWGTTMLGFHHGHKVKNEQLPLLFASQFPRLWGDTTKREIHCGHRHHKDEKEYNGATVIQHPTLAARDAYAARGGWIADRAVQAITYHRRFGQVGRVVVSPEMLAA